MSDVYNFATIGGIYEDGVSLIFDGEEEESEKHYRVNTSVIFHVGDRVRILEDSGTYVAEYVVGTPAQDAPVPEGGSRGQFLAKQSAADGDVGWETVHQLPAGGTAGQALIKNSATNYDTAWDNPRAASLINLINALASYDIQLRTTNTYSNPPVFQIRRGSSGTWYTISLT